ncbi:ATP-binding protein [Streptomyces sp. NPDC058947]|uniref:ATP-binding protein n=1 Tax=Streptomyces sp. NPDC058947 TaxID=3346675 RepID=UPI00367CD452
MYGREGMGGTRLVEEFAEEASSAGYTVVWGRCTPPWSTSRAVSALGPLLDVQARLGVAEAESKAPTGPPTRGRRNAVRLAQWAAAEVSVHRIARAMDYGPVVCVLEDLHWASRELLRAVGSLASLCSDLPCVLLRTMHEPEAPSTVVLSGHLAQLGAVQLTLGPPSTADVRTALAARGETDDPHLAGELRRRTDVPSC